MDKDFFRYAIYRLDGKDIVYSSEDYIKLKKDYYRHKKIKKLKEKL